MAIRPWESPACRRLIGQVSAKTYQKKHMTDMAARLDAVRRRAAVGGGVGARQRRRARQVRGHHLRAGQRQHDAHHACRAGRPCKTLKPGHRRWEHCAACHFQTRCGLSFVRPSRPAPGGRRIDFVSWSITARRADGKETTRLFNCLAPFAQEDRCNMDTMRNAHAPVT